MYRLLTYYPLSFFRRGDEGVRYNAKLAKINRHFKAQLFILSITESGQVYCVFLKRDSSLRSE
jgi:predicted nucleotidyltransferase